MKNVAFIGIETPIVIGILHTQHIFTLLKAICDGL